MWRTPRGVRVSTGAEAKLLRQAIAVMLDDLITEFESGEDERLKTTYRVKVFDDLPVMQRLGLLHAVASALLLECVPPPQFTAANEGTVAAIINSIEQGIWFEIDCEDIYEKDEDKFFWRTLVLACNEVADPAPEPVSDTAPDDLKKTDVRSPDYDDWEIEILVLKDQFLWDIDYQYTDIPDMPPEQADAERTRLDIGPDYYTAVPPDPHEKDFESLIQQIRDLCHPTQ